MSPPERHVALVAAPSDDGDFAESTLVSLGYHVSRYESVDRLARDFQQRLLDPSSPHFQMPSLALVAGPLENLAAVGAATAVRAISPTLPLLVIGSGSNLQPAVDLMKQGANDVLGLPCSPEQVGKAIRQAVEEADALASEQARAVELRVRLGQLTKAEKEILAAMLEGRANKQMAQQFSIGLRTVELRRSKIMRKMQAKNVAQLVKLICLAGGIQDAPTSA